MPARRERDTIPAPPAPSAAASRQHHRGFIMPRCLFRLAAAAVAVASTWTPALAEAAGRPLAIDDFAKIRSVGDPQRSPDGKWVAYTVGTVDVGKDKRNTDIWMVSWDGKEQVQLTSSPDGESRPRWSPDGKWLAFLASRGDEETKRKGAQVWLLNRAGGEAQQVTDVKGGVTDLAWAPDSKRLVLAVNDFNPADEPEKTVDGKPKTKPPIVLDRYRFKQDVEGYLQRFYSHLWLFEVDARKAEQLTKGWFDDESPTWSPDGTRIAFVSARAGADPDRSNNTDVFVIEAKAGAEPKAVTTFTGADTGRPAWSPDGQWIAYLQGDEARFGAYDQEKLAVAPAGGGAPRLLTSALDRTASGPVAWTPDGKALLFHVVDDRSEYVARVAVVGGAVEKLTTGRRVVSNLSGGADGALAVLASTATELPEVHALERGELRRLTNQNAWLADIQLGVTEDLTSTSKDGTEVHSLLVKPADAVAGKRYPTILHIHGGPKGQDQYSFSFDRELYAANGYAVLAVNYRGSDGRGSAFQKAIYADWGNKEVMDLLGAVDQAVAAGVADPDRLGLGGWSYGGILTDATISLDTRFKAAVSGAGVGLQLSFYGVDHYIVQWDQEIGPPWKNLETYLKISGPFLRADKIKTPTLFMCGEKDFNVPLAGSEQMYQALRSLGVETELVIYPGQFHGITMPSYLRDRYARRLAWYDKYLKGGVTPPAK